MRFRSDYMQDQIKLIQSKLPEEFKDIKNKYDELEALLILIT